jgi:hypothetical protein
MNSPSVPLVTVQFFSVMVGRGGQHPVAASGKQSETSFNASKEKRLAWIWKKVQE